MCVCIQLLALEHSWSFSTGSRLTMLLRAPILLRATTACLPTGRTGWDHSAWTIMSWWRWQNVAELTGGRLRWTHAYKNLFRNTTGASILAVTMLRSSLSMYIFFVYNNFFLPLLVNNSLEITFWIALVCRLRIIAYLSEYHLRACNFFLMLCIVIVSPEVPYYTKNSNVCP
jgi:hypothetical protein